MEGSGSLLKYGTVTNCSTGVEALGAGGHYIIKVTARSNENGFFLDSPKNTLKYNTAAYNVHDGFDIRSDDNKLSYNTSTGNDFGYDVDGGNRNTFKANLAKENDVRGFQANGHDNTFTKNRAISNVSSDGFNIEGNRNKLILNLAKDNGVGGADDGFEIKGNDVKVLWNKSIGSFADGFAFRAGSGHTVLGNTAKKNGGSGIELVNGVINSSLLGNVALGNTGFDLFDGNDECDDNKWKWNWFKTTNNPSCIH